MVKQILVSPMGEQWKVKNPGAKKAIKITKTQKEGFNKARGIAINQGLELIVQGKDGTIKEKNTYPKSRDKFPPKE